MSAGGVWNLSGSGIGEGLGVAAGPAEAGGGKSGAGVAWAGVLRAGVPRAGVGDLAGGAAGGATLLRFLLGAFFFGGSSSTSTAVSPGSAFSSCSSGTGSSMLGWILGSGAGALMASGSTLSSLMTFLRGLPRLRDAEPVGVIVSSAIDWLGSALGSAVARSFAVAFLGLPVLRPADDPDGGVSVCAGGCVVCLLALPTPTDALPTDLRGALLAGTGVKSSSLSSAAGGEEDLLSSSSESCSIICFRFAAAARRVGRVDMTGGVTEVKQEIGTVARRKIRLSVSRRMLSSQVAHCPKSERGAEVGCGMCKWSVAQWVALLPRKTGLRVNKNTR